MRGLTPLVAAAGLAAIGCVKIPEFTPRDGGGSTDDAPLDAAGDGGVTRYVTIEPQGNQNAGVRVTGPNYTLEFSDIGLHFPHQLVIDGQLLMGGGEACGDEHGMGIAVYPAVRVNGITSGAIPQPLEIDLDGPLVGRVTVRWAATYECTSEVTVSGVSRFSFFPDGRVMRFDRVDQSEAVTAADCASCAGGTASSFYVTSFTTLQASAATLTGANIGSLNNYGDTIAHTSDPICLSERDRQMALAWRLGSTRVRVADTTPVRTLAFVYDWRNNADTIGPFSLFTNTVMKFASGGSCATLNGEIGAYTEDIGIQVTAGGPANSVNVGAALADGIYGGNANGLQLPAPPPVTLQTTGGFDLPPGIAVWLDFDKYYADFTFSHSANPTGTWHDFQRVSNTGVLFWFWSGLRDGDTITIDVVP